METNEPFCHFLKHKGKSALADFPLCYTMKYSCGIYPTLCIICVKISTSLAKSSKVG